MLNTFVSCLYLKGQVDHDPGAMGYELIEEPELVIEELESHQKKHHDQDVLQSVKSKHDAENLAIKLLATRLTLFL